jgi:uncharacterized membrane protein YdbT with pleckstrin-like domain
MALINCPECGKQVSTAATACPSCGYPIGAVQQAREQTAPKSGGAAPSQVLLKVHPSWWGYFWHLVFFWLLIPPIIAWWHRISIVLKVYPGRIILSRGVFSKCNREFVVRDIRAIDIDQSFLNRIVGIGTITISTSATVDADEKITGIKNPYTLRDLILAQRGDT